MIVLGIPGSLRERSHNRALLLAAAELLPPGVELELFDGLADVPLYNEDTDHENPPAGVRELRQAIERADALLFATPEYNGSVPGVLKNAIDWASRPGSGGRPVGQDRRRDGSLHRRLRRPVGAGRPAQGAGRGRSAGAGNRPAGGARPTSSWTRPDGRSTRPPPSGCENHLRALIELAQPQEAVAA